MSSLWTALIIQESGIQQTFGEKLAISNDAAQFRKPFAERGPYGQHGRHRGMSNSTLRTEAVAKAMAKNKSSALSAMSSAFDRLLMSDEIMEDPPPPPPPPVVPQVEEKRELSPASKRKLIEAKMQAWAGAAAHPVSPPSGGSSPQVTRRTSESVVNADLLEEKKQRRISVPAIKNFEVVSNK
jgi:hypothetical protein